MLSTASEHGHIFSSTKEKEKSASLCYLNAEQHCQHLQYDRQHFHKTSALTFLPSDVLDSSSLFQITYICLYTSIHYISLWYISWMSAATVACYAKLYIKLKYKTNQILSKYDERQCGKSDRPDFIRPCLLLVGEIYTCTEIL